MHKNTTKWLITLLAGAVLTCSTACKDKPNPDNIPTQNDTKKPETTETKTELTEEIKETEPTDTPESNFSSGVEPTKQISALSDEEKQQLLKATNDHVPAGMTKEQLDQAMCTFGATISLGAALDQLTTDEMLQQACAQSRDMCLEHIAATKEAMDISIFPDNCDATVAETEACLGAQNKHGAKFLKAFPPCDELTLLAVKDPTLFAGVEALNNAPSECEPLATKCPGFLTPPEQ